MDEELKDNDLNAVDAPVDLGDEEDDELDPLAVAEGDEEDDEPEVIEGDGLDAE